MCLVDPVVALASQETGNRTEYSEWLFVWRMRLGLLFAPPNASCANERIHLVDCQSFRYLNPVIALDFHWGVIFSERLHAAKRFGLKTRRRDTVCNQRVHNCVCPFPGDFEVVILRALGADLMALNDE